MRGRNIYPAAFCDCKTDIHLPQKASQKSVYNAGFTQVIQTKPSLVFHPKPFSQEEANPPDQAKSALTKALISKMLSYSINQRIGSHTAL